MDSQGTLWNELVAKLGRKWQAIKGRLARSVGYPSIDDSPEDVMSHEQAEAESTLWYRSAIKELLELKSENPVSNGRPENQANLTELFFDHGKGHIRLFTYDLDPEIYGQPHVVYALRRAEKRCVWVDIITQIPPSPSAFTEQLKALGIPILVVPPENITDPVNFLVIDDDAVRFQSDHRLPAATAWPSNKDMARKLAASFDIIKASQEKLNAKMASKTELASAS